MRKWTEHDEWILKELYPNLATPELAILLKKSVNSVSQKAFVMGVKKSNEYAEKLRKAFIQNNTITRFRKGSTPANKGKKVSQEVYEKLERTMFKKGNVPHNVNYDGHERISRDGYIEVRISQGKYVLKHRHIWEQENGAIPKGMVVVFRDKNPLNVVIDNLQLITMRENMLRNTIHRYPKDLQNAIRGLGKLKRKIKSKQTNSKNEK